MIWIKLYERETSMLRIYLLVIVSGITLCHDHETSLPTECQMPPDTNDCGSEEKRWFYHHNVRSCTEYTYRGCERSTNNFKTKEECEKLCLPPFEEKNVHEEGTSKQLEQKLDQANKKKDDASEERNKDTKEIPKNTKPESKDKLSSKVQDLVDEDNYVDQVVEGQDHLRKQFNMADKEDFLTLETLLQDKHTDESEIIPISKSQQKTGDIVGELYSKDVPEETIGNDKKESMKKTKKIDDTSEKLKTTEKEEMKDKKDEVTTEKNLKPQKDPKEKVKEDDVIEEQIKEEEKLMDRFSMADSDDMLALQEVVQSPNMEVLNKDGDSDIKPNTDDVQQEDIEESPDSVTASDDESQNYTEEKDEELLEETERRKQFSMADNEDYRALEELMVNPNMEEMELVSDGNSENSNEDKTDLQNMDIELNNDQNGKLQDNQEQDLEAEYGEHLDHETTENDNGEKESEDEAAIKFEQKLEEKFNMADRDDVLSLEQIIQDPNVDMAEMVPSDDHQTGDINGVLSLAASFLGENNKEEISNLKEVSEDIKQLPNVARGPIDEVNAEIQRDFEERPEEKKADFTHPAEKLREQQQSENNSPLPDGLHPINFQRMGHNDKMMLISLLHLDGLKVNKIPGTTTPILKPLLNNSPKPDFIDVLNLKGVRKCCLLPRDPGPCKKQRILQWHFDPMIRTCLPFFYGGCEGNRNRFDTIGECLRKCGTKDVTMGSSIPEPIPEPPTFTGFNNMISNLVPGKILSLQEKMSPNQQRFIHKFIKSALKHITDVKPVKIGPMLPGLVFEKRPEKAGQDIPMPLRSIMFKWPILRMVFDKRNGRALPFSNLPEPREGPPVRIPVEKFMRPGPRGFRGRGKVELDETPFNDFRKRGRDSEDWKRGRDHDERKRVRDRDDRFYKKHSKHFSPSFKKSYKMMSHHEDKRHQISSDPKNKVNLIQVFVNKPNTESHSSPTHHHTMIKKQFSPEPQIKAPLPPAPPVNRNTPPQAFPPQPLAFHQSKQPMPHMSPPSNFHPPNFPQLPLVHHVPYSQMMPDNHMNHQQQHYHQYLHRPVPPHHHHSHPLPPPNAQTHFHVHQPFIHHRPLHPFFDHPKPWWMRSDRPFYEPKPNNNHPHIVPSTGYPQKDLNERSEDVNPPEEKEKVLVVTVPPGENDGEPHYACLLPVSTGTCKAFLEKFYFNIATGECEMFIYGGCGGNANNFGSKEECQATCTSTSPVPKLEETTTRPDDTIIITSPVYVPDGSQEDKKTDVQDEPKKEEKQTDEMTKAKVQSDTQEEEGAVKVEPVVSVFRSSRTEYIIIIAVMCFVGLAVIILVALAVANFSRRNTTTKKERVLEAVLSSHLEGRSIGSLTPSSHYYGQPPSETGPPPISDVPKIHKESFDEQL